MRYIVNDDGVYLHADDLELQFLRTAAGVDDPHNKRALTAIASATKEFAARILEDANSKRRKGWW